MSPPDSEVKDFAWNPAVEGLYSYCLIDGSLHIHEISGTTIKCNASLPNANALSGLYYFHEIFTKYFIKFLYFFTF